MVKKILQNKQLLRFGLVGLTATVIDFGLLFSLKNAGLPVISANIISTLLAFVFSFSANRKFTFRSTSKKLARQISRFIIVTLFGLWILQSIVIVAADPFISNLIDDQSLKLVIAKLLATIVSMTWNYIMYARVVFNDHDDKTTIKMV